MTPLHCLWAKSNNRARGQFECDVFGFVFVFISFVPMDGAVVVPYGCLRFQLVKKKNRLFAK